MPPKPSTSTISRVSNSEAERLAKEGWVYVPKSVYKRRNKPTGPLKLMKDGSIRRV